MVLAEFWCVIPALFLGSFASYAQVKTEPNSWQRFSCLGIWIVGTLMLAISVMPTSEEMRINSSDGIIHNSVFLPLLSIWLASTAAALGIAWVFRRR